MMWVRFIWSLAQGWRFHRTVAYHLFPHSLDQRSSLGPRTWAGGRTLGSSLPFTDSRRRSSTLYGAYPSGTRAWTVRLDGDYRVGGLLLLC